MELINRLPLPASAFRQFDRDGKLDCVLAVRGTFNHVQGKALALSQTQEAFQWEDAYEGDPHRSILLRQTDLTPEKPGTDVTFLGQSHAMNGEASTSWLCGLRIGALHKQLRVHGERSWRPVFRRKWAGFQAREPRLELTGWRLSEATATTRVTMSWTNAYGGAIPGSGDSQTGVPPDVERHNPLGCGIVNLAMTDNVGLVAAPSVTAPNERDLDWRVRYEPQGLGPVSPWWRQRQRHAGTYDDAWLHECHPLLPEDFNALFWQSAPPDLIAIPWLRGDEAYQLDNLHPSLAHATGTLPGLTLGVHCQRADRDEWFVLNLDGVQFDWREDERVLLTWRARFPLPQAGETRLTLTRVRMQPATELRNAEEMPA